MKKQCQYLNAYTIIICTGLFLVGCNSSNDDTIPQDDFAPSINPPSEPTDLRSVVYSSSAIELKWNAAIDNGIVVEYQVFRDGTLVATQNTLRFFENALTGGTTHTYSVLAVNDEGNVSDAAVIDVTTLADGPIVGEANYSVILPYVVNIANGNLFDDLRAIVDATDASWLSGSSFDNIAGLTLVDQGDDPTSDLWYFYTYQCEFGGTYDFFRDNWIQFGGHFKGYYDACEIGGYNVSGDFSRLAKVDKNTPNNESLTSDYNLTVKNDLLGSHRNLTGKLVVDNSQVENRFSLIEASYFEHNQMWDTTITNIIIDVYATDEDPLINYAVPFNRTFEASFHVQAPHTGDKLLTVSIEFETTDHTELHYQTGSLTVAAEDGSSIRMVSDNGESDTFQLSLFQDESITALTIPWSEDYRLKCFQAPAFDARLAVCE